ncbi:MAG TPA: CBS domain-containing protein [Candidatus Methylomirabilis sp.]|nr:CBS domain-containing protein [Candidatus Methylomirabilis sp.]
MLPSTTIEAVMTPYPYSVEIDAHLSTAKAMLAQFKVHHMPVRDGDKWVGVVTTQRLDMAEALGVDLSVSSNVRVRDLCRHKAYIVGPGESLVQVLRRMAAESHDSALVVKDGKLLGIFTATDALKRYADAVARG